MFDQRVINPQGFPVSDKNRKSTDICCTIIGAIFALTMFIVACCVWSQSNYDIKSAYTDSNGQVCQNLYYPNIKDLSIRQCVKSCPAGTTTSKQSIGNLCVPNDDAARELVLNDRNASKTWNWEQFKKTLLYTAMCAFGIGLIWMTLVHLLPTVAPILAIVGSVIFLITIGVLLLVLQSGGFWSGWHWLKITTAVFCFVLALILIVMLCMYKNEVKFQGIFLDYATNFLNRNPMVFLYIPVYLLFTAGLIALITWQAACFSSAWGNKIGWLHGGFFAVMNILEFIWGLQFLRDSFNFCVSGAAADWYWSFAKPSSCFEPYKRLLCNNWGSVVGGSFLNAFFEIPTLLVELLVCHPQTCCSKIGTVCYNSCTCLTCFFDLVRTDAYSYINFSGIPFCNAARQCRKICDQSHHFIGTHSPMKHYRFAAHIFCVAASFICGYFILRHRVWDYSFEQIMTMVVMIICCVTYFIGIHADSAEGLQTSFLAEHELEPDYRYLQKCLPSVRDTLKLVDSNPKMDGNC